MMKIKECVTIVRVKKKTKMSKKGIDKRHSMWYKYSYSSLMRIESRAGRGCDTLRLHHKYRNQGNVFGAVYPSYAKENG